MERPVDPAVEAYRPLIEAWRQDLLDMQAGTYRQPLVPKNRAAPCRSYNPRPLTRALTPLQFKALSFIREYSKTHHFAPTYDEICAATGQHSKSAAHRVVHELERRGYVAIEPGRTRGIEVLT